MIDVLKMNRDTVRAIGHYEILDVIGQGGMGTVYKAMHTHLQHVVALKLMHPHLADKPEFQSRFLAECRAIAALDNPNIIRVYDVALLDGLLYMVMEYIDGGTLRKRLNAKINSNAFLDLREIVTVGKQVAQALHYAHGQGIIHRDVKPDNVLLRAKNNTSPTASIQLMRTVLTDFGLAKRVDGAGIITTTGELLGTLAYMAPEQFRDVSIDSRTDIYSFGVMLYELVSGRQPFISPSAMDVILMHTQGEPERIQDLRPDTPNALVSIIHRAMLKNPDDRYETAGEIARELEALEKTIKPLSTSTSTWRVLKRATLTDNGPATIYDVLPALDRPAIPVDLLSDGTDDIVIVTPAEGQSWSLPFEKPSIIVGRDANCDLRLEDPRVSRQHVRIDRLPDGQIAVTDLSSLNGVFMGDDKIDKNTMKAWPTTESIKIGPFWLTLRLAKTPVGQGRRMVLTAPRTLETSLDMGVTLRLSPADSVVEPGSVVIIRTTITNHSDTPRNYVLNLQGIAPDWFTIAPFPVTVSPGKSAERLVTFHPPRLPTSAAMNYEYMVSVSHQQQERSIASLVGALRVFPYYDFETEIEPPKKNIVRVGITNQGNSQRFYVVELRERNNVLIMLPSRARTLIAPGQSASVEVKLVPKRRPMFGVSHRFPVEVFVRTDGLRPQTMNFEYAVRPWIPWETIALLLLMAVGLIVAALTFLRG